MCDAEACFCLALDRSGKESQSFVGCLYIQENRSSSGSKNSWVEWAFRNGLLFGIWN